MMQQNIACSRRIGHAELRCLKTAPVLGTRSAAIRASKKSSPRPRQKNRKAQPRCSTKRATLVDNMKDWEIIADRLSAAGWSWGCVSAVDSEGRTFWIADAHCGDGKRFVVHADEKLTAFVELERAVCIHLLSEQC